MTSRVISSQMEFGPDSRFSRSVNNSTCIVVIVVIDLRCNVSIVRARSRRRPGTLRCRSDVTQLSGVSAADQCRNGIAGVKRRFNPFNPCSRRCEYWYTDPTGRWVNTAKSWRAFAAIQTLSTVDYLLQASSGLDIQAHRIHTHLCQENT